ncbi:glycine zipper 2TM domain-containing protein [Roseateles oligotrophus]|uniref:Glycine zipper 2TM domain-containing protein n=1 Tax=Roseateles oligotrophus TaxID=1769250 RepID=A0ABT2YDA5_9BURK|nr:glycine zipper 2TM domain-containing protein [Roseateles oligotrophus]MCV2368025.1 glycine zipper 2TM domain-containing protein [Roseateles oligotrophus]
MKSVQIAVGGVAVLALLGGAFQAGRSQILAPTAAAEPAVVAAPLATLAPVGEPLNTGAGSSPEVAAPAKKVSLAPKAVEPPLPRQDAQAPVAEAPKLCAECATVVDVRSEQREGKASGIGVVGGALLGGLLGHQVGGGTGKKLATVAGAAAGGFAGNQVEKSHGAHQVWTVRVSYPDGGKRSFEFDHQPEFRVNAVVRVHNGSLERY